MSKMKAKEFIEYLIDHPEVADKMKGFTHDELIEAGHELKKEGKSLPDNGGGDPHFIY